MSTLTKAFDNYVPSQVFAWKKGIRTFGIKRGIFPDDKHVIPYVVTVHMRMTSNSMRGASCC